MVTDGDVSGCFHRWDLSRFGVSCFGPIQDRYGARRMLCAAVLVTGVAAMLLSLTQSLLMFVLLFCIARMVFAGPFDLGIYGAVNSWFRRDRGRATSITTFTRWQGLWRCH